MPPLVSPPTEPRMDPQRLVLLQQSCFYCGDTEDVQCARIHHLFGILHCPEHAAAAEEDCREYMHSQGIVRFSDAQAHLEIGPFLEALGTNIPVLRTSGDVEDWRFPVLDVYPLIRKSVSTGSWGFQLFDKMDYMD